MWIGVRETRRLRGRYVLTRDDVLAARDFPDAIARCGAPVEDHADGERTIWEYIGGGPSGATYGIPFGCLCPLDVDNLLVAGRCLSATHDAHASVRSMGQCMAMGQAAGTAAALAGDAATRHRRERAARAARRPRGAPVSACCARCAATSRPRRPGSSTRTTTSSRTRRRRSPHTTPTSSSTAPAPSRRTSGRSPRQAAGRSWR